MAITTDTLAEINRRVFARMTARIPALINAPDESLARVFAAVVAGVMHEMQQSTPAIAEAAHPATASGKHLTDLAQVWGVHRKDNEADALLRGRLHLRLQQTPGAGTLLDWERWAKEQPEVAHAWVINPNPPDVYVYVVNADGGNLTDEQLAAARAALDLRRPAGCPLFVASPARTHIVIRLNAPQPVPQALQDAITRLAITEAGNAGNF